MPLSQSEFDLLAAACRSLAATSVQDEEKYVAESPILTLMSTVLSLNRRWYNHALPARRFFEENLYQQLTPQTLSTLSLLLDRISANKSDWTAAAQKMWNMNEWDKCRMLSELIEYLLSWKAEHCPDKPDSDGLKLWASTTTKEDFLGKIKGLGPRAHEQLLWYIEGTQAIKLDRHVVQFVYNSIGRSPSESDTITAIRQVAAEMGISPTELDARIWDFMQSHSGNMTINSCKTED